MGGSGTPMSRCLWPAAHWVNFWGARRVNAGMKSSKFWIVLGAAGIAGLVLGWAVNYLQYGQHRSEFAWYSTSSDLTPVKLSQQMQQFGGENEAALVVDGGTIHDFGSMRVGQSGEHLFVVRNEGTDELTLAIGQTSCKCTLGDLQNDRLAPGEETQVKLSWTVKTNASTFSQQAELITNDPSNANVKLTITGNVIREFTSVPETLNFGSVTAGQSAVTQSRLYSYSAMPMRILSTSISDAGIDALATIEVTEVDAQDFAPEHADASQAFDFSVSIESGMPQGRVSQYLIIGFQRIGEDGQPILDTGQSIGSTSLEPGEVKLQIPLQGGVIETTRMLPTSKLRPRGDGSYLYRFGKIDPGTVTRGTALVMLKGENRRDISVEVDSVSPEPFVSATVGQAKHQKTMSLVPIEITIDPSGESLDYQGLSGDDSRYGRIMISTDDDNQAPMALYLKFATQDD